jgi:hypothetical protein
MRNYWSLKTSLVNKSHHFLKSSRWDCPYIIRLGFNNSCYVYDTRQYANMGKIDHSYYGYSVVSSHLSVNSAKAKIARLMKEEEKQL